MYFQGALRHTLFNDIDNVRIRGSYRPLRTDNSTLLNIRDIMPNQISIHSVFQIDHPLTKHGLNNLCYSDPQLQSMAIGVAQLIAQRDVNCVTDIREHQVQHTTTFMRRFRY